MLIEILILVTIQIIINGFIFLYKYKKNKKSIGELVMIKNPDDDFNTPYYLGTRLYIPVESIKQYDTVQFIVVDAQKKHIV